MQSQSSTTQTFVGYRTDITETTAEVYVWTASREQSTESVSFYQTTSTASFYTTTSRTEQLTKDTTTTVGGTMIASATALVVQANTNGPDAEIVYYVSSRGLKFAGLSAASKLAKTATRVTLSNIYSTAAPPKMLGTQIPSFSWSNASLSYSTKLTTTIATTAQTTLVTDETILPNGTIATEGETIKTDTTSLSANLWTSNSGECSDQAKTTTSFIHVSTSAAPAGSVWLGSLSWNVPRTRAVSRTETTSTEAAYERSTASEGSASGVTVVKNIALLVPPQVTTATFQNVRQSKFVPVFAQIASSRGRWFTVEKSTFSSASFAGLSRSQGKTILPESVKGESYGMSALTYSSSSGTSAVSSTAALGVAGETTTACLFGADGAVGGAPNANETFGYGVSGAGAFKNRIGGEAKTLDAGATTFSASQDVSFLEPITGLIPVRGSGSTALFPLFWAAPRNSTALPNA
jgi:hypothetical protein